MEVAIVTATSTTEDTTAERASTALSEAISLAYRRACIVCTIPADSSKINGESGPGPDYSMLLGVYPWPGDSTGPLFSRLSVSEEWKDRPGTKRSLFLFRRRYPDGLNKLCGKGCRLRQSHGAPHNAKSCGFHMPEGVYLAKLLDLLDS